MTRRARHIPSQDAFCSLACWSFGRSRRMMGREPCTAGQQLAGRRVAFSFACNRSVVLAVAGVGGAPDSPCGHARFSK
jgi:hypothetical protein